MAFGAAARHERPIEGAVATLGVSDRVDFLRKTYTHLGIALIAFAVATGGLLKLAPNVSWAFSSWAMTGWTWLLVILLFMGVGVLAERLARSSSSRAIQYLGLTIGVAAYALIFQPIIWKLLLRFGPDLLYTTDGVTPILGGTATSILMQAALITIAIFVGLTLTVFVTKKDFSFLRGALTIGTFAALGVIVAAMIFGFHLGALFCGLMILLMAGYVLYETSLVMSYFPPTGYVAASLMLFGTIATLFFYVLRLMMSLRSD